MCLFKFCQKRHGCLRVPSHIGIYGNERVMKGTLLPSLHWICRMPRLVYPNMILNIVAANIFFPLGKIVGMVWLQTSFILSSQSWEIDRPPTGSAGRMKLSCVIPELVIHIWPIHISPPLCEHCQCILTVCYILVEWNHFSQERKDIFGRRDVVESFLLPTRKSITRVIFIVWFPTYVITKSYVFLAIS